MFNDIITLADGTLIHNPYNTLNVEVCETDIRNILTKYGIPPTMPINNIELYKRAFVHPSYTKRPNYENEQLGIILADKPNNCLPLKSKSFQNLEFLGDGVLELVAKFYIYRRFPKSQEGFKTTTKIAVTKNSAIGKIALEMGLNKWMLLSHYAEDGNVRYDITKQLGNLFEAFIGAMFLDFNKTPITALDDNNGANLFEKTIFVGSGFQMTNKFIESVFENHIDWTAIVNSNDNYKKILQESVQKKFCTTPMYITLEHNKDNNLYHMGVFLCVNINVNPKCESAADILKKVTYNMVDTLNTNTIDLTLEVLNQHMEDNKGKMFAFLGKGILNIKKDAEQKACYQALTMLGLV